MLTIGLASSTVTFAQEETAATISGHVTDATGATVVNATVIITNKANGTERRVQTNEEGYYSISPLSPRIYTLVIEQMNFKKHIESDVTLNAKDRRTLNAELQAGSLSEKKRVEVSQLLYVCT